MTFCTKLRWCKKLDKVDGFIRAYDKTEYSIIFGLEE